MPVVFESTSSTEAQLICGILRSHDIQATIPGENLPFPGVALAPFSGTHSDIPGTTVLVHEQDVERAKQLIADARRHPIEDGQVIDGHGTDDGDEAEAQSDGGSAS